MSSADLLQVTQILEEQTRTGSPANKSRGRKLIVILSSSWIIGRRKHGWHPVSGIRHPASGIQRADAASEKQMLKGWRLASGIRHPKSGCLRADAHPKNRCLRVGIWHPASGIQRADA
jgi:hypothetical protein